MILYDHWNFVPYVQAWASLYKFIRSFMITMNEVKAKPIVRQYDDEVLVRLFLAESALAPSNILKNSTSANAFSANRIIVGQASLVVLSYTTPSEIIHSWSFMITMNEVKAKTIVRKYDDVVLIRLFLVETTLTLSKKSLLEENLFDNVWMFSSRQSTKRTGNLKLDLSFKGKIIQI